MSFFAMQCILFHITASVAFADLQAACTLPTVILFIHLSLYA